MDAGALAGPGAGLEERAREGAEPGEGAGPGPGRGRLPTDAVFACILSQIKDVENKTIRTSNKCNHETISLRLRDHPVWGSGTPRELRNHSERKGAKGPA